MLFIDLYPSKRRLVFKKMCQKIQTLPFLRSSCLYRFLSDNNIRPDFFCQYDKILKSAQSAIKNQQQSTQNQKPNKQSSAIKSQKQLTVKQKPNELLYQSKGVKGITQLKGKTCTYFTLYFTL